MKPTSNPRSGGLEPRPGGGVDNRDKTTPESDLQPNDAGTADSGNVDEGRSQDAKKQGSKTGREPGGAR
jgi:hypothetical protein